MAALPVQLPKVLDAIRTRADQLDQTGEWPSADLDTLANIGAMRWAVPTAFGGDDLPPLDLHLRYEQIAAASVAVALILSQRDSAVGLLASSEDSTLPGEMLPKLARNELFTTVGIAQLTTSRQGGPPALRVTRIEGGYQIDGIIPWATGAAQSAFVVCGAAIDDGRQILFALPTDLPGVAIAPPLPLVALRSTWTTQLTCSNAMLADRWILRQPGESALASRRNSLALGQTFIAMGLVRGALDLLSRHDSDRARSALARLESQLLTTRDEILRLSAPGQESNAAAAAARLRGQCNDLALRVAHTAVTLYKGTALLAGHPAQRLAREAMFLLVWSCPNPVIDCTVDLLTDATDSKR